MQQQSNIVITGQPQPTHVTTTVVTVPSDYMSLSLFTCLCCFWPLGIVALVFSFSARDSFDRGDTAGGENAARIARILSLTGIGVGVAALVITIISVAVVVSSASSSKT